MKWVHLQSLHPTGPFALLQWTDGHGQRLLPSGEGLERAVQFLVALKVGTGRIFI